MKRLATLFALIAVAAFGADWTGYVSCVKCGAKHKARIYFPDQTWYPENAQRADRIGPQCFGCHAFHG